MAHRKIREFSAKELLYGQLPKDLVNEYKAVLIKVGEDVEVIKKIGDLENQKVVVKPDMLFGKRGKHGLVYVAKDLEEAIEWAKEKAKIPVKIGKSRGELTHFLIEPFIPHKEEYYVSIKSERDHDILYFSETGGIDIEENWGNVKSYRIESLEDFPKISQNDLIQRFLEELYKAFVDLDFTYLESNPFVIKDGRISLLDLVAEVDDYASYKNQEKWKNLEFPPPFGKSMNEYEKHIFEMDKKTSASLKLTILNREGKIWLLTAGGGASLIYADSVVSEGLGKQLANYGEYSGNPTKDEVYEYTKTLLKAMKGVDSPILIIGGAIANFTDVRETFKGISKALREEAKNIKNLRVFVRRGGPNEEEGLKIIKETLEDLRIEYKIFSSQESMLKPVEEAVKKIRG